MSFAPALLSLLAVLATPSLAAAEYSYRNQGSSETRSSPSRSQDSSRSFFSDRPATSGWRRWGAPRYDEQRPAFEPGGYRSTPSYDYRGGQ